MCLKIFCDFCDFSDFSDNNKITKLESDLENFNQVLVNSIIESYLKNYDPDIFSNDLKLINQIEKKFQEECISKLSSGFDYHKYKTILLNKIQEKRKYYMEISYNNKLIYYCVFMTTNNKIKIKKTNKLRDLIEKNKNTILYIIEYIDNIENKMTGEEIIDKYKKIYNDKYSILLEN